MPPCGRAMMDVTTGHPPYPPINFITGASTVLVNSMPCLTVGSMHLPHGCTAPVNSPCSMAGGSSSVFANSKPVSRLGDMCSCPECLSSGSGNVIVN